MSREPASVPELRERLAGLMLRDRRRLTRRLDGGRTPLPTLVSEIDAAQARVEARRASVPAITYPEWLPVSRQRDTIAAAIAAHQVVVLAGETGSGKTTQLPKILLEAGRGITGLIGHTQPRRIAARAVAERVAEELGEEIGEPGLVGYAVRFEDRASEHALIKVMTDGILLAELSRDPDLLAYDTIVIDEAHERSLTIDFLLGYLTKLLPRRPDLKVVVTSATIDPGRFARHFGGAPVLTVSGRTFPVEIRYRPPGPDDDPTTAVVDACAELARLGDTLVFLSGEREIRDTAEALGGATDAEVVPLYGRLTSAEQHRVFEPHTRRRIVLATNVAETSLTVPGIRCVVDPGTARVSRYSLRTKVQRLPIEPISQASATQRAGRCGRVADGVCIRLYAEEDFASRPAFTEPEIRRTNLASVLLRMADLGLGDVADFPFLDPPDPRAVRDGTALLAELGALSAGGRLSRVGRQLAQLPVDPRMARMLIEAGRSGCVAQVLVIAAALSVQDPRERPLERQQEAAELHARFADPTSDLLAWLGLWDYVTEQQKSLSGSAFRRLCRRELLSWLRIREWQDLHAQLRRTVRRLGLDAESTGDPATVSQALLAGLLSQIGLRQEQREYLGARGVRFVIAPGTPLARKPPPLVVAAELVETSRLYARGVARIEPEWVERVGADLLVRTYAEPHWERRRAGVVAFERVTLYGVPIVARRRVSYGRIEPEVCRDLFLRSALVEGDWQTHHAFWAHNRQVLADVEELARRARRRDLTVDDQTVYDFYDARIPPGVVDGATFDRWWKTHRRTDPRALDLVPDDLAVDAPDTAGLPSVWTSQSAGLAFDLSYDFDPGTDSDGVTVEVPIALLGRVRAEDFGWQVPGLRRELVIALLRTLPKAVRVPLGPAPDLADRLLADLDPAAGPLLPELSRAVRARTGVVIAPASWDLSRIPVHLRPSYRVLDAGGTEIGRGRDLGALQESLAARVRTAVAARTPGLEVAGLTAWSIGDLPAEVVDGDVVGYPTLLDEGASVAVRVLAAPEPARHHAGCRRLLVLAAGSPVKAVIGRLSNRTRLTLATGPHGTLAALLADATDAATDTLMTGDPRTAVEFAAASVTVRAGLPDALLSVLRGVETVLAADAALDLDAVPGPAADDLRAQRAALLHPGFVTAAGAQRLPDLARYVRAMAIRAERASRDPARDAGLLTQVRAATQEWATLPTGAGRDAIRWQIEELRVGLFAQTLRTKGPVSLQRIYRAVDEVLAAPS